MEVVEALHSILFTVDGVTFRKRKSYNNHSMFSVKIMDKLDSISSLGHANFKKSELRLLIKEHDLRIGGSDVKLSTLKSKFVRGYLDCGYWYQYMMC